MTYKKKDLVMKGRKSLSKKKSKRSFKKGLKAKKINLKPRPMRGGTRF